MKVPRVAQATAPIKADQDTLCGTVQGNKAGCCVMSLKYNAFDIINMKLAYL